MQSLRKAAELLRATRYWVALTGAGVSTPSGIPDFRSPGAGLWNAADPLEVASLWGFHDHPERFYRWIRPLLRKAMAAQPNRAHYVLAQMEAHGRLRAVITQNIDSLHQRAGSQRVLELHGHMRTASCLSCRYQTGAEPLLAEVLNGGCVSACPRCGGLMKPDVVLFGEPIPYEALNAAQQEALACDVMLVVGTSLEVMPAADLPLLAKRRGARLILINLAPTALDEQMDVVLRADVVKTLQALWHDLQKGGDFRAG